MKKNVWIISLVLCLILSMFAGCGSTTSSTETAEETETTETTETTEAAAADTAEEAEETTEAAEETAAAEDVQESEEAADTQEGEVTVSTISYPIPGDYSFSVVYSKPTILSSTVMTDTDYDSSYVWDAMVEATGVTLEWEGISEQAWDTQIGLIMASGDYPDACNTSIDYPTKYTGLVEDDVMMDLSGYIEEYMPNYYAMLTEDEDFAKCVYEDNGMLVLIQSRADTFINSGLNIRQDWLDELGMDTPTTVDELTEFLLACKTTYDLSNAFEMTADLNVCLNIAFNVKCEGDRLQYQLAEEGSNEIVWSATTQNFRDYIELLRDWYAEGIFNDDFLNVSNANGNVQSTFLAGEAAVWGYDCSALLYDDIEGVPMTDLTLYDDASTNISGVTDQAKTGSTGMMMVFSTCENPEIFCEFIDYFFSEEGTLLANWGIENETFVYNESGDPTYTDLVMDDTDCFMYLLRSARYALYWAPSDFDVGLMIADYTTEQMEAVDMWVSTRGSYLCYPPNFQLSDEDQEIANTYETDCSTYFWEHVYKVICNQESMEDFDAVVQTALDMGMQEVVDAYNHSYAEYLS